jgi:hypothetical protein
MKPAYRFQAKNSSIKNTIKSDTYNYLSTVMRTRPMRYAEALRRAAVRACAVLRVTRA